MSIKRMKNLTNEIFKTINNLNAQFLKEIFKAKINSRVRPNDNIVKTHNAATYGGKSITVLGPKVSRFLPENVNLKAVTEDLRNILIHGFVPSVTAPIINTLQERPRLLSTQIKLSNITSDLHK